MTVAQKQVLVGQMQMMASAKEMEGSGLAYPMQVVSRKLRYRLVLQVLARMVTSPRRRCRGGNKKCSGRSRIGRNVRRFDRQSGARMGRRRCR